ncbi:DUF6197 family protein [Streptomyces sp. NPDC002092]
MTTTTLAPASPPPALDLDTRLALRLVDMTARLDQAAVAFEVNTAHIAAEVLPEITAPLPLTPTLTPAFSPYSAPLADLLHRARVYIETNGWLQGGLREDVGMRRCPLGAIRIEAAGNRHLADDACVLLLEAIQRDFPDAATVPSWNDQQTGPAPVLLYLDRAAQLAADRDL